MKEEKVSVFYYKEFGYIIASYTEFIGSRIPTLVNPVMTIKKEEGYEALGSTVWNAFDISKNALPVERDNKNPYQYWHVANIKGFAAFSKKFQSIKINKNEDGYEFLKMKRADNGGYISSKEHHPLKKPNILTTAELEQVIQQLFADDAVMKDPDKSSFITVYDNVVEYTKPSDDFEDSGDGHTDAYQVYVYEENDKNYISFLIDNPYTEIKAEIIRARWEQMYGKIREFQLEEIDNGFLKIRIYGRTDAAQIEAYLYQDGDHLMEVTTVTDILNTSMERQKKIREEFKKIINSIKISALG